MKEKMLLKKSSYLTQEYNLIKALLSTTIILVVIGILIEFGIDNKQLNYHKSFVENLVLGAAASSFISFITVYIQYNNKKHQEKLLFDVNVKKIFLKYKVIINCIKANGSFVARRNAKELIEDINNFSIMYEKMNFCSKYCLDKHTLISKDLLKAIFNIIYYLDIADRWLNIQENFSDEEQKFASQKIYSLVLKYVKEEEVQNIYSGINTAKESNEIFIESVNDMIQESSTILQVKERIIKGDSLSKECFDIYNKLIQNDSNENKEKVFKILADMQRKGTD